MKKIVGIYDNTGTALSRRPISVFPVYTDGRNYFLKCMSENLDHLIKVLRGLTDEELIDDEIDAYINQEDSLYSKQNCRYNDDSNYCYHLCSSDILRKPGFHSLNNFESVKREQAKESYHTSTYAIIDSGEKLIIGSFDYITKFVSEITNLDINKINQQEELVKKINLRAEIKKFFV